MGLEEHVLSQVGRTFPIPGKPQAPPGDTVVMSGEELFGDGRARLWRGTAVFLREVVVRKAAEGHLADYIGRGSTIWLGD